MNGASRSGAGRSLGRDAETNANGMPRSRSKRALAVADVDVEEGEIEPVGKAAPGGRNGAADAGDVALALDDRLQIEGDEGMVFEDQDTHARILHSRADGPRALAVRRRQPQRRTRERAKNEGGIARFLGAGRLCTS